MIVTPTDGHAVATPADLGRPGVRIIAAGDAVPITRYAVELVANLARQPGYPDDFEAPYAAERRLARGQRPGRSDEARARRGRRRDRLSDGRARRATGAVHRGAAVVTAERPYDGVVMADSAEPEAARSFLAWLTGPEAQALLADDGFLPPGP